jgi:site-specific recombinase XerD
MMHMDDAASTQSLAISTSTHSSLDSLIAAWLHEKQGGSSRTVHEYRVVLGSFRAALQAVGLDLDSNRPDHDDISAIALVAQTWADQRSPNALQQGTVSPATHNLRLNIVSSFYVYAIKHRRLRENPIALVARRKVQRYAQARPLPAAEVQQRLQAIDRSTLAGQRDYALLLVALTTGRRLSELAGLRWGAVQLSGKQVMLTFCVKGNRLVRDTLAARVGTALLDYLQATYTKLATLPADAPVWVSFSRRNSGAAMGIQSIADVCQRHLGTSKVHALRHTFAHTMLQQGATVSTIQQRLGHTNLSTTSTYLQALESADNPFADVLAEAFGGD